MFTKFLQDSLVNMTGGWQPDCTDCVQIRTVPSWPTLLGHVAFHYTRERYSFAVREIPEVSKRSKQDFQKLKLEVLEVPGPACPSLLTAVHLGYWSPLFGKAAEAHFSKELTPAFRTEQYLLTAGSLLLLGQCGDLAMSGPAELRERCAPVWCTRCPNAFSELLSMANDELRLEWLAPAPAGCEPLRSQLDRYLDRWRASRPRLQPVARASAGVSRIDGSHQSCPWFCKHIRGDDWAMLSGA